MRVHRVHFQPSIVRLDRQRSGSQHGTSAACANVDPHFRSAEGEKYTRSRSAKDPILSFVA